MPIFHSVIKNLEDHLTIDHKISNKLYKRELYLVIFIILIPILLMVLVYE